MSKKTKDQDGSLKETLLSDNQVKVREPEVQIVNLRLKQNAFIGGEFYKQGSTFILPKDEALELLRTTTLYEQF